MELREIHDRIAIVFNNLEHKEDTENSELLSKLLEDLQLEIQQGAICGMSVDDECPHTFSAKMCRRCPYYISEDIHKYFS